jgi:hypothetical protein
LKRKLLLTSLCVFYTVISYSQSSTDLSSNLEKTTYKWFDSILGQKNSDLSLGPKYFDKIRTINNNHKYYTSPRFQTGNITYNNQPYFDIKMKYDIHFDQMIIQRTNKLEKYTLQLEKSKIQRFSLMNKNFINITTKNSTYGFVEELKKGKISLYKKHFKQRFKRLDKRFKYSLFKDESFYLVFYKNKFTEVRSKDDLRKQFPSIKKEINQLYKASKSFSNTDAFMANLITKIESLISN